MSEQFGSSAMRVQPARLVVMLAALVIGVATGRAEFTLSFTDKTNNQSIVGTGNWTAGPGATATVSTNAYTYEGQEYSTNLSHYVIFEGEISNTFTRLPPDGSNFVHVQMLAQMNWVSAMPAAGSTAGTQAALCVSNGQPYALSADGWILLADTNTVDAIDSITNTAWTKLGILLNYEGGYGVEESNVFYRVVIDGHDFSPNDSGLRYKQGSPYTNDATGLFLKSPAYFDASTEGIANIVLMGDGTFDEVYGGGSGGEPPLAAGIAISAVATTNGCVVIDFSTVDEAESYVTMIITVSQNGAEIWRGTVESLGGAGNNYQVTVPSGRMEAGQQYTIVIVDDQHVPHSLDVTVANADSAPFVTKVLMVRANTVTLQWNSKPECKYYIEKASRLGATWERVNVGLIDSNSSGVNVYEVVIADGQSSGFFRIVEVK
ncbi:MAG: hypothetical protein PHR35_07445 [Kiritimatiellae bacterium]|nr:hypothetical protein [Kiritimatiellia bacterium]